MTKSLTQATLCALMLMGAPSAHAADALRTIGQHPFSGTHAEACELHVNAHGQFTTKECLTALPLADNEANCSQDYPLQDGTRWWMLFTIEGQHVIKLYTIAFGDDVPEDDPRRAANNCTGVQDGRGFIKPLACGNYAVPPAPPAKSKPEEKKKQSSPLPITGTVTTFETELIPFPLWLGNSTCCADCCCTATTSGVTVDATGPGHRVKRSTRPAVTLPGSEIPYDEPSPYDY